jgi:hypothetical protein
MRGPAYDVAGLLALDFFPEAELPDADVAEAEPLVPEPVEALSLLDLAASVELELPEEEAEDESDEPAESLDLVPLLEP